MIIILADDNYAYLTVDTPTVLRVRILNQSIVAEFYHHHWKSNLFNNCERILEKN